MYRVPRKNNPLSICGFDAANLQCTVLQFRKMFKEVMGREQKLQLPVTRCDVLCTVDLYSMRLLGTVSYLTIYFVRVKYFKCSLDHAKRSFRRTANFIFEKIGRMLRKNASFNLSEKNTCRCLLKNVIPKQ